MPSLETEHALIQMDEPCLLLHEMNMQSPDSSGFRRYQFLDVVRKDERLRCRIDLGPAGNFKADQFQIPSGVKDEITGRWDIMHTVAELREMADQWRDRPPMSAQEEPSDLIMGYYDQLEQKYLAQEFISVDGPHIRVWRN